MSLTKQMHDKCLMMKSGEERVFSQFPKEFVQNNKAQSNYGLLVSESTNIILTYDKNFLGF